MSTTIWLGFPNTAPIHSAKTSSCCCCCCCCYWLLLSISRVGQVMASAFCGLPTHMVRVAEPVLPPTSSPVDRFGTCTEMWAEGDWHSPRGWPQLWGETCMGLVMTAKRIGLGGATAAISPMPQRAELTKQYLFKVWPFLKIMCRRFLKMPPAASFPKTLYARPYEESTPTLTKWRTH